MASLDLQFYTHGCTFLPGRRMTAMTVHRIDCRSLPEPPIDLCIRHTGLDRQLANVFWRQPAYQDRLADEISTIEQILQDCRGVQPKVLIEITCKHGMHRSVAMADKLRRHFSGAYPWLRVGPVKHYDIKSGIRDYRRKYGADLFPDYNF